jgi:hypothetical protein
MIRLPMHVPDGTRAEVILPAEAAKSTVAPEGSFFDTIRDLIGSVEGPPDMASRFAH